MKNSILRSLQRIVGEDFVSNDAEELFLYSKDLGSGRSGRLDYVVVPGSVAEVQKVVEIAGQKKLPLTPVGAGLNLSGLTIPSKGGIAMDMKRMDNIIEVNEFSRYTVVEAGVTIGKLVAHLKKKHPTLRFSVPDAPPTATITANAIFNGSGHLSKYGVHPEMINGLEVVLPNAEICRIGSCAISPYWFGRSPLPELTGLFVNWFGTTGVATKMSLKLYPRHDMREMLFFRITDPGVIPKAFKRLSATELMEDILILVYRMPGQTDQNNLLIVYVTADNPKEFDLKVALFTELLTHGKTNEIVSVPKEVFPEKFLRDYLAEPKSAMEIADLKKGGGFEYLGVHFPNELIPEAYWKGCKIVERYGFDGPLFTIRNIGIGQGVIFTFMYPFDRSDEKSLANCQNALIDTTQMTLDIGGVPWKPSIAAQQMILKKMDPGTLHLMRTIRRTLDPDGIMNPGQWDIG
ncbi:FAD-binding oxidoreductase [uncultured Desulfobacter sp.]|uniref:FAD-binding oxidoreductase n=1 Tax=uncultured Desulfobacter sp. TaxID=240139 RepID=UPI0029C77F9B|nr:FAD-binding oxidoreductase [uncultured Desulfobacter sp.]